MSDTSAEDAIYQRMEALLGVQSMQVTHEYMCGVSDVLGILTTQDLMQLLAHKLQMEDKMLALFEVAINESMPDYFDLVADMEILTKEGATITYGVEK